jgi:hypothetical protein
MSAMRIGILLCLLLADCASLATAAVFLSGRVLEGFSGDPLAGASVTLQGTECATVTDSTGFFRIADPPETAGVLRISCPGYEEQSFDYKPIVDPPANEVEYGFGCVRLQAIPTPRPADTNAVKDVVSFNKRIASLGDSASYPAAPLNSYFDPAHVHDTLIERLGRPAISTSAAHPFLDRVLPDVSFAAVPFGPWRHGRYLRGALTNDGRFYQNDDLNSLLLTMGYTCDGAELQTIAKIAILLQYFTVPDPDFGDDFSGLPKPKPGLPPVAFRSFNRETMKKPFGADDTILTVLCAINGKDVTAKVHFYVARDGRMALYKVTTADGSLTYRPGRPPASGQD